MNKPINLKVLLFTLILAGLTACGGGGGGAPPQDTSNWGEMVWDQDNWE